MRRDSWKMRNNKMTNNFKLLMGASSEVALSLSLWIPISVACDIRIRPVKNNESEISECWFERMVRAWASVCAREIPLFLGSVWYGCMCAIRSRLALEFSMNVPTKHQTLFLFILLLSLLTRLTFFFSRCSSSTSTTCFSPYISKLCYDYYLFRGVSSVCLRHNNNNNNKHEKILWKHWK